jgi:N-acetylglucosamine-6-phosphate deacetylase
MQITNVTVYQEDKIIPRGFVEIQNDIITAVGEMEGATFHESAVDLSGYIVAPGFIDQHVHGAYGADVMDASPEALDTISSNLVREGTTSFLATTTTVPTEKIHDALKNVAQYTRQYGRVQGAEMLGVHLEGPFISSRFKGAQNEAFIHALDTDTFDAFQKSAGNSIKMVTYAAENDPGHSFLNHLKHAGVVPSCGHSNATFAEVEGCTEVGLQCLTHFHNAMSCHHHRHPGVVSAGLCLNTLKAEIIADGIHLHPDVLKMVYKLKGKNSLILITDAISAKGLTDGRYKFGEQPIIKKGMMCNLESGVLAGSVLSMDTAIRNMVKFSGCSLFEAVQMASLNPARLLGVDHSKGSIAAGKDADLVVLDNEGNLHRTIVRGQVVYKV